jgi:type III restriction enzyme
MILLREYQEKAVKKLLEDSYLLLKERGRRQKMVFRAPTGSGKTVTMAAYINELCESLASRFDMSVQKIAVVWIAPNQLHLQSYDALKNYFQSLRSVRTIHFEDITDNCLHPNEILFLNWQSINKESNLYIRDNEQDKTLVRYIENAQENGTEVILVLDEAHYFATKGEAARKILQLINGKIEVYVSATIAPGLYGYTIHRAEVIEAEMIKRGVLLNPALDQDQQGGKSVDLILLEQALHKRDEIAGAYKKMGVKINPLLLIQLPNDSKTESYEDIKIRDMAEKYLDYRGIKKENHRLAVWLSHEKSNLEGIENYDSITDVLLFKQAIALGWDCPRAAVLLIYREIKQETFGIQTVGRILRMPEQKFYTEAILNTGYIYTNLSASLIQIVAEDMDYIVQNRALRIPQYQPLALNSAYINHRMIRNRLGSQFFQCLAEAAEEELGITMEISAGATKDDVQSYFEYNYQQMKKKLIEMNVAQIEIPIPRDIELSGGEGATEVQNVERFVKTPEELNRLFFRFCQENVGSFAKSDSAPVLELALLTLFEEYLTIFEYEARKIILYSLNRDIFVKLIDIALRKYEQLLQKKAAESKNIVKENQWDVPPERIFNEQYLQKLAEISALEPFYEKYNASKPEREFVSFLERNKHHIQWWYKNGERNKEDFSVAYIDREGGVRGFFVDFIILMKSGRIALFDTKTIDSDLEFINKHNALNAYIIENSSSKHPIIGGVIVPDIKGESTLWKFSTTPIQSAKDISDWTIFDPAAF